MPAVFLFDDISKQKIYIKKISSSLLDSLDPFQFAYKSNRTTEDTIALATHTVITNLDKKNTYMRMHFTDYSSAFNIIIPSELDLGLKASVCNWMGGFVKTTARRSVAAAYGSPFWCSFLLF